MNNNIEKSGMKPKSREIDVQWFLVTLLCHWKLFLFSAGLCLFIGFIYLRYSIKIYNVGATVILKDDKKGGMGNSELSVYEGMRLVNPNSNVDNEVEMFTSRNLVQSVVSELRLYIRYSVLGKFKDTELYGHSNNWFYKETPVTAWMDETDVNNLYFPVILDIRKNGNYIVSGSCGNEMIEVTFETLPAKINTQSGSVLLQPSTISSLKEDHPLHIVISHPLPITKYYLSCLSAEATSKTTSVVKLGLNETHRKRGEDFLDKLIEMYNRDAMEDKNKAASNASRFISERLDYLSEDLNSEEGKIETYKRDNQLTDLEIESQLFLSEDNESNKQLIAIGTQVELLGMLKKELNKNIQSLLPANLGLTDPNLAVTIGKYNAAIMEKERFSAYTSEESPIMIRIGERIELLREDVRTQVEGLQKSFVAREKDIRKQGKTYESYLYDIPRREREYAEMTRLQQIKANLYTTLLQKKEEAELSLAVTAPSAKVMNSPLAGVRPVSPKSTRTYALCLLLGLMLPYAGLGLRNLINYKVEDETEIGRGSLVPVMVSLPMDKSKKSVVVSAHATTPVVERFRLLRTNLLFSLGNNPEKKVMLITSTISGEGKTFVSINLAMTFALKYKTLLIGLDIRRPKLDSYMQLSQKDGIVSYLAGFNRDIDSLIQKNVDGTGLDVMVAGSVPPNPNELLMESSLDELFRELRNRYEYIIVDTSPVGSVSDPFLLDRISDISLFVVRQGYTPKAALALSNDIFEEKRLKNLFLVLNGFGNRKTGRYGYGYGYGYGYSSKEK